MALRSSALAKERKPLTRRNSMNAEHARKTADHAIEQLAERLKQGHSDTLTRYLAVMARFHRYSFGNLLLIVAQRPDATNVAGFNAWKRLGRHVRKGEKGIAIFAPMRLARRQVEPNEDVTKAEGSDERTGEGTILRFRVVHVFDVSQTEGAPLPEPANVRGDPAGNTERLRDLATTRGITVEVGEVPMGVEGVSLGGRIVLRSGLLPAQEFSVLAHEIAHELLHRGEDRASLGITVRETEAEAVAFVVCTAVGLEVGTAASDYIQLYRGDTETLSRSLDRIQRTAAEIIEAVMGTADTETVD